MDSKTEHAYERAQDAAMEAEQERQEAIQAGIESMRDEQIKDVEIVGNIIEQNAGMFAGIFVRINNHIDGMDIVGKVTFADMFKSTLERLLENEIKEHL